MGWGEVIRRRLLSVLHAQLAKDLKMETQLRLAFVIGRLSDFDMNNKKYPHWKKVRDGSGQGCQLRIRSICWVDTDDLNDGLNRKGKEDKK